MYGKNNARRGYSWVVAVLLLAGCATEAAAPVLTLEELAPPAGPGSGRPHLLTAADGRVFLSWTEPTAEARHALRFAVLEADGWSAPRTIAEGADWFVNWADVPALSADGEGRLTAHFLKKRAGGPYAYDVQVTRSADEGRHWSAPLTPHRDATATEHGFVSLLPGRDGHAGLVWLDGRNMAGAGHGSMAAAMTLRYAEVDPAGQLTAEALLDGRTCDCCQTAAVRTPSGAAVFYRDRTADEVRDISVVRLRAGRWSEPERLHADGWRIAGCPVNGPAADAAGRRVAVAWFTAAQDTPRVQLLVSEDEGATFGRPVAIDDGHPLGRVDVALLDDGRTLVSWLEGTGDGAAEVRVRAVHPDGTVAPAVTVAASSAARASGFPRMTAAGRRVVFAWTDPSGPGRLRTAVATWADR